MGQKVNPVAFRLGINKNWKSRWFSKSKYQEFLREDFIIREFLQNKLKKSGLGGIEIERSANSANVIVFSSRPGLIIGRGGSGIEDLRKELKSILIRKLKIDPKSEIKLSVEEIKSPESKASIVAQGIADQLERRMPFRRTIKQSVEKIMQSKDVQGAKVMVGGRLDGNEIARREWTAKGKIPLQTLRANIDYAQATAFTIYGTIGIKVWVYFRDIFEKEIKQQKRPSDN